MRTSSRSLHYGEVCLILTWWNELKCSVYQLLWNAHLYVCLSIDYSLYVHVQVTKMRALSLHWWGRRLFVMVRLRRRNPALRHTNFSLISMAILVWLRTDIRQLCQRACSVYWIRVNKVSLEASRRFVVEINFRCTKRS